MLKRESLVDKKAKQGADAEGYRHCGPTTHEVHVSKS